MEETINLEQELAKAINEDPSIKTACELHKNPKLKFKDWIETFKEETQKENPTMTQKEIEEAIFHFYLYTKPKTLKRIFTRDIIEELQEENLSIRQIAKMLTLPKSTIQNLLKNKDKNILTTKDIAFRCDVSETLVRERKRILYQEK